MKTDLTKSIDFYNKTTEFVMPVLGERISFYSDYLYNAYFHPEFDNCICVVVNNNIPEDKSAKLETLVGFVDKVEHLNYFIYIYQIPDEYLGDINLFKQGKYSLMSKEYKEKVLFLNLPEKINFDINRCILYGILFRKEFMRKHWQDKLDAEVPEDAEYWSIPDMNDETLFINELKLELHG